ncbi:MAG TPA: MFS transporter [Actinospica sp.]|nr:MFS transporter [Actinospica sp.]
MSSTTAEAFAASPARSDPYPRRWAAAVVMIFAALLDLIDGSIVNTALPSIGRGLHTSPAELQWTVSAYLLGFAATLIIAGHLGDRYGRKPLFLGGVAGFAAASLASAAAGSPGELIASRAVQGVAAAVLMPQVLASFRTMFSGAERGKVFAIYGAIAGVATAVGVLLGGVLTDWNLFGWGWRTVFAVNIPLALAVLVLGALWVPGSRERSAGRLDVLPNLVLSGALVAVVLPLVEGRSNGWPQWGWCCLGAGVLALVLLSVVQSVRRGAHPLLPTRLFRARAFSAGLLIQLLFFGAMSGFMLAFTIWLQSGQGYSPAQAGLLMVAFSGGAFLTAPAVDGLVARFGRSVLIIGGLMMAGGFGWTAHAAGLAAAAHTGAWPLVPGLVVGGAGLGLLVVPLANVVLTAVPAELAGGASGLFSTAQQFGGALGVAVIGNVFFAHADRGLTNGVTHAGPWAVGAFALCALLCLALPRTAVAAHHAEAESA